MYPSILYTQQQAPIPPTPTGHTPQPSSALMPPPSAPPPSHIFPTPSPGPSQLPSPSPLASPSSSFYINPVSSPRTPMSATAESLGIVPQLQYEISHIYFYFSHIVINHSNYHVYITVC